MWATCTFFRPQRRIALLCAVLATLSIWVLSCEKAPNIPRDLQPPAPVTDLAVADSSSTWVRLQWAAPADPPSAGAVKRYELRRWTTGGNWDDGIIVEDIPAPATPRSRQTVRVSDLDALSEYHFQIRSCDESDNWSPPSNEAIGRTQAILEREPPNRITTLAVIDSSQYSLTLRWTAPADPPSGDTASRYELRQEEDGSQNRIHLSTLPSPAESGSDQTYVVRSLQPQTRYRFTLRAADANGNWSAFSNEAMARTRVFDASVCPPFDVGSLRTSPPHPFYDPFDEWFQGPRHERSPALETDCPARDGAPSAYSAPLCHPRGALLGFNHIPVTGMVWPYGPECDPEFVHDMEQEGFWLADADGSNMRRLGPMLGAPQWSPDGNRLAFTWGSDLCSVRFLGDRLDDEDVIRLTCEGPSSFPAWSPDGRFVAYTSADEERWPTLWLVNADGTGRRRLASPGMMPTWGPDPDHIVYLGWEGDLYRVDIRETTSVERLTAYGPGTFKTFPRLSPDGSTIAFLSTFDTTRGYRIWLLDAAGGDPVLLSNTRAGHSFRGPGLTWSPDGTSLLFEHYDAQDFSYTNSTIWSIDVATKTTRQLTQNPSP